MIDLKEEVELTEVVERRRAQFGTFEQNLPKPFLKVPFWPLRQERRIKRALRTMLRQVYTGRDRLGRH